jgi:hypothetical protein
MSGRSVALGFALLIVVVASTPSVVCAQDDSSSTAPTQVHADIISMPTPRPVYKEGIAEDETVQAAVGDFTYEMLACASDHNVINYGEDRKVAAHLSKADILVPGVADALLLKVARYAWETCPEPYYSITNPGMGPSGEFHYNILLIIITGPDGSRLLEGQLGINGNGDRFNGAGNNYEWYEIINYAAKQREAADAATVEQQNAQARATQIAASNAQSERDWTSFWAWLWGWIRLIGAVVVVVWTFVKREAIARWYYGLQPHPATAMVDRALYDGGSIDGAVYARILQPIPGSRVEQSVRSDQAHDLTRRLRKHEAALRSESAKRVDGERRRVERENAFLRAHAELLRAGVDHEVAAAQLAELKRQLRDP